MGATVAAEMLEWFRKEYGAEAKQQAASAGGADWDYLSKDAAAAPPGAKGVDVLTPHVRQSLPRGRSPFAGGVDRPAEYGHPRRHVAGRFEGLDYHFLQILRSFESAAGVRPDRIVAVGGAIQNEFWMQNKADVTGKTIEAPELDEAVPLGAAILAGIGVGLYHDEEGAFRQVYKPGRSYDPRPALTAMYAERFQVFEQIYPALKEVHGRLHDLQ